MKRGFGVSRLHMPDNNLIEQDHRSIKLRLGPMLGFKQFRRASTTIAGKNV
jgi:transposase-like protein